ncbi:MAG TPA: ATP-binding protein [Nitrospira sp.]|nr:ATP-binding protein [Nitrospira sp.]
MRDKQAKITDVATVLHEIASKAQAIASAGDTALSLSASVPEWTEFGEQAGRLAQESRTLAQDIAAALQGLDHAVFRFRTIREARSLAALVAVTLPDPRRTGIGLCELLLNAVEHGNLGITYEDKGRLLAEDALEEEVAHRLAQDYYAARYASLEMVRGPGAIRFTIKDQGDGFDWKPFLEFVPERLHHAHGRGIAIAHRLVFNRLEYQGRGNEVIATVDLTDSSALLAQVSPPLAA